uniref:probable disease resistance protein At5g66900 n=1 Tax=Erigeron canadensis TaxID=72917 RepID=UPI001CB922B4|nr:probable disease resistance protein At5g66900 [Erigeron canadensis]
MVVMIETALELAIRELLKAVVGQSMQTARFKTLLKRLKKTLNCIESMFYDSRRLNKVLDRPEKEIMMFVYHLETGKEHVLKCSKINFWNVYQKFLHSNKLVRLNNELLRFFQVELQTDMMMMSTSMRGLIGIYDLSEKMDRLLSAVTSPARPSSKLCSVPGLPYLIVGFDQHLEQVKRMLLDDDDQVMVVSGPGGCGKTTLVKLLCHDNKIKDIFGANIFYITVSRTSSLKTVVQKLFEHLGENHYEFQTNEEATNQLQSLMKRMESQNMLLILDDVWSESEYIIQELKFHISGYKILVTSRFLFPRFNSTYELSLLSEEDSKTLLCYSAFPNDGIHVNVPDDLVNKIVKLCKGLPLALTVVGASLCGQSLLKWKTTLKKWSDGQSILQSNSSILHSLKSSIDSLDELSIVKECFLDLGSFPEDERIAATILLDMWVELYNLDDEGMYTTENLVEISLRNLIKLAPIRKEAGELEGYCNELYVKQHNLLRDLAIHLSSQEPVAERKRLFIEIHENRFPIWWKEQITHPISTQILSISTDDTFDSTWNDLQAPKVEVLTLNIQSKKYALPQFIEKMDQMKVLSVTGYGVYPSHLQNLSSIRYLSNVKRIRFEHVSLSSSIRPIFELHNLKKLAFVMCEFGDALMSCTTGSSPYILPNLTELVIDRCYDLKGLPSELCNLGQLVKLSITNCHELETLPKELGSLSNLESLMLHCCTKLQEIPESIGSLSKLSFIDISDCLSVSILPEEIGELSGLKVLRMSGCRGLQELPMSMSKLWQLEDVICDEETSYLWMNFESDLYNLKINVIEDDRFESFMKIIQ